MRLDILNVLRSMGGIVLGRRGYILWAEWILVDRVLLLMLHWSLMAVRRPRGRRGNGEILKRREGCR